MCLGGADTTFVGAGCGGSAVPLAPAVEMKWLHGGLRTIFDANGIVWFLGFVGVGTPDYMSEVPVVHTFMLP